jgi:DNA-directed RNA polymerase specialized sigma24 family protein
VSTDDDAVDFTAAPKDYEDLYRTYFDYVVSLVRRHGIQDASSEDVASEILLRFFERDFLTIFDPTMVFEYKGESRPARFKSFLSKFVLRYVRGHWDRQHRLLTHERLICDMPVGGGPASSLSGTANAATWLELHADSAEDHAADVIEAFDEAKLINECRDYLKAVPRKSHFDHCDLVALFDAIVEQVHTTGQCSVSTLRKQFKIGPTAMHSRIWWLRENLAQALDRPLPAKRPCARNPTP